jgi:hypothetical protein
MIRRALLLVLGLALTAPLFAALAGEPGEAPVRLKKKERKDSAPAAEQKKDQDKKDKAKQDDLDLEKELRKQEGAKGKEQDDLAQKKAEEELKELVNRLHKNMQASEDRLGQKDPGDATREIQKDILKDLDELIKQQGNAQSSDEDSQSQEGGDGQSQGQKKSRGNAKKKSGKNQKQGMAKGGNPQGNPKPGAKNGKGQSQQQAKGDGPNNSDTPKGESGKGNNRVSEIYKDLWGNYPERQRQEMDTYARERFMPRYEELLRQYYRTISEQSRKTKGD